MKKNTSGIYKLLADIFDNTIGHENSTPMMNLEELDMDSKEDRKKLREYIKKLQDDYASYKDKSPFFYELFKSSVDDMLGEIIMLLDKKDQEESETCDKTKKCDCYFHKYVKDSDKIKFSNKNDDMKSDAKNSSYTNPQKNNDLQPNTILNIHRIVDTYVNEFIRPEVDNIDELNNIYGELYKFACWLMKK